jgi:hypothetical protein
MTFLKTIAGVLLCAVVFTAPAQAMPIPFAERNVQLTARRLRAGPLRPR